MKLNKWTLGLAAVGMVSYASVSQAEEATSTVMTALSSTVISGYVDVAAHWNLGTGAAGPAYSFAGGKSDGFNLNAVLVKIEKPLEEGEWSAGYTVDLMYGADATGIGGEFMAGSDNIRQAYVALRAPVGNGLDLKLGRWDTIIGYESSDGYKNPNYTRSYGYSLTPTEHTGLLATYQALDFLSLNLGVANTAVNTAGPFGTINAKPHHFGAAETEKTYLASVSITAPDDWGFMAGSVLTAGIIDGFAGGGEDFTDYYLGLTMSTGVEGLKVGADFNIFDDAAGIAGADAYTTALYASFKATEKMGVHARAEYGNGNNTTATVGGVEEILAFTATLQYDLWENVLSRLELRWDHDASGGAVRPFNGKRNEFLVAANLVYKF